MFGRTGTSRLFLTWAIIGCGVPIDVPDSELVLNESPIEVWAEPPSSEFGDNTEISLSATDDGSQIYYTLDGSDPSGDLARPYAGPIALSRSTLITFIARTPDAVWSKPKSEFYASKPEVHSSSGPLDRDLWIESNSLFMAARAGAKDLVVRRFKMRSVGLQRLTIDRMVMTANPNGGSIFNAEAFSYEILTDATEFPLYLEPGETLELEIYYRPTVTFSSAAIVIQSNAERDNGRVLVELWGRVVAW